MGAVMGVDGADYTIAGAEGDGELPEGSAARPRATLARGAVRASVRAAAAASRESGRYRTDARDDAMEEELEATRRELAIERASGGGAGADVDWQGAISLDLPSWPLISLDLP